MKKQTIERAAVRKVTQIVNGWKKSVNPPTDSIRSWQRAPRPRRAISVRTIAPASANPQPLPDLERPSPG